MFVNWTLAFVEEGCMNTISINQRIKRIKSLIVLILPSSASTQLKWGWDSLIFSSYSHPPTRESSKMEILQLKTLNTSIEDFKYFNWKLQILQLKTSNSSIEVFKYVCWRHQLIQTKTFMTLIVEWCFKSFNWRLRMLQLKISNTSIEYFK